MLKDLLFSRRRAAFQDDTLALTLSLEDVSDPALGISDGYTYHIYERHPLRRVGYVSLRIGESPALYYLGHIGYRIEAPYRGHGYAQRACSLMMPLLQSLGITNLCITANPDNIPSRKTCERLGCELESIVTVPPRYLGVCAGDKEKCRYILFVPPKA